MASANDDIIFCFFFGFVFLAVYCAGIDEVLQFTVGLFYREIRSLPSSSIRSRQDASIGLPTYSTVSTTIPGARRTWPTVLRPIHSLRGPAARNGAFNGDKGEAVTVRSGYIGTHEGSRLYGSVTLLSHQSKIRRLWVWTIVWAAKSWNK